ncbi:MAG: hypothetical protein LBQ91_03210 [Oscillospiraceae bacterium]|nr:hypothetical protein [Oscillospiraceae bacterium]
MKKPIKLLAAVLAAALLVSTASCKLFDKAKDALNSAKTGDELYSALEYAVRSAGNADSDDLPGTFTFSAYVTYEADSYSFEDEEKDSIFIFAVIARDFEHDLVLDVTDYKGTLPKEGDYISVKATFEGSVSWIEDGEQTKYLWLKAAEIAPLADEEPEVNTTATTAVSMPNLSGELTFKGAHFSEDIYGEAIVVYFDFKNTGSIDTAPLLSRLEFYTADETAASLSRSNSDAKEFDGSYLSTGAGITDKTSAGKTLPYFLTLKVPTEEGVDASSILIEIYDDNFNLAYQYQLDVAENLAALS